MMKHEQMIPLIGDLFINAYVAGDRKDTNTYSNARASRDHMYEAVAELYAELEHESYEREQFEVELMKANKEIDRLKEEIERRIEEKKNIFNGTPCPGMKTRLSEIYGSKLTDPDEYLKREV